MKTVEINGSAWKLKYYFIAAVPLAVLTVILPLIILPTFHFLLRYLATHSMFRGLIHWTWIIVTLVLNLYLDFSMATQLTYGSTITITTNVTWVTWVILTSFGGLLYILLYISNLASNSRRIADSLERCANLKKGTWWMLFYCMGLILFSMILLSRHYLILPPYFIYFVIVLNRLRRQKMKRKKL